MEGTPMSLVDIVKLPLEVLGGKGISLQSDCVSTNFQTGSEECKWREKDELWVVESGFNWPFRRWLADKVCVHVLFEYNGCDVNNARLALSSESFIRWYNDKATFQIRATGALSKLKGLPGCKGCEASAIVEFDVALVANYDFVRTANRFWIVRVFGDGTVKFIDR